MAAFSNFAVSEVGNDLVINFRVTVDGAAATGATWYRQYAWDGTTRTQLNSGNVVFVNNLDGTYTVTIPGGVATFAGQGAAFRHLVILRTGANALEVVAYGDYPNAIPLAGLASNQACIDCHGESGEVGRFAPTRAGGHYSAPMTVDACVVCHLGAEPGLGPSYGQIAEIVHGIHAAKIFPDGKFVSRRNTVYETTYPTYMSNCSVCHSDDNIVPAAGVSALAAANAMPVTFRGCLSCHGSMDAWEYETPGIAEFHSTMTAATDCFACHNPDAAFDTVAKAHNGIVTERGGVIWDGVDTSVTEGAKIDMQITGIVDDGTNLAVSWTASYAGNPVNPCNETLAAGAPLFHLGAGANFSLLRSYAQGDDFILGTDPNAPGQAQAVNVTATNTACAGTVATTTIPVHTVGADVMRGVVALQGRPRVVNADPAVAAGMPVRAFTPTREWIVGTGALPAETRRLVVDSGECLKCHVGSMYQHGGNRIDNVDMCILCHNSASSEQNVRVGMGVEAFEAYDGLVGQSYEMKTMLHAIHSAGVTGAPYVVYRNRGIYAWAGDVSVLNNWPGSGSQIVYGSNDVTQNHTFHAPTYPRALNACAACHTPTFDVLPNQAKAMALTLDAGSTEWANQLDDTLEGASAAACMSCHSSSDGFIKGALDGHAYQFGWFPQVFPEGRKTIIDTVK